MESNGNVANTQLQLQVCVSFTISETNYLLVYVSITGFFHFMTQTKIKALKKKIKKKKIGELTYRKCLQPWHCVRFVPSETSYPRCSQKWLRHWSHNYGPELTPTGPGNPSNIPPDDLRKNVSVISSYLG